MRRFLYYLLLLLFVSSLFHGCSKVSDEELTAARSAVKEGAILMDVRTPSEYKHGHIKGSVNLPLQVLDRFYKYIPKDKELVVYCRTGSRSEVAAKFLREQGFTVYDVATQEDWEREIK